MRIIVAHLGSDNTIISRDVRRWKWAAFGTGKLGETIITTSFTLISNFMSIFVLLKEALLSTFYASSLETKYGDK